MRTNTNEEDQKVIKASAEDVRAKFEYGPYYELAETAEYQWLTFIQPFMRKYPFDLTDTLELAPGHGRHTNKLRTFAQRINLVDYNSTCIEKCRERFGATMGKCQFIYIVNDGVSLHEMSDESVSFVYTWDAMVHFDKLLVRQYISEFVRVLKPNGYAFVHHSNYGEMAPDPASPIDKNPNWRSTMSAALFREYCSELDVRIVEQKIIDWGEKDLDCISIFRKV